MCLLVAPNAWAAIAFDSASGNTKAGGAGNSITVAHTATGTGTDGLLLAFCGINTGGGTSFTGMTWNGTALTQLETLINSASLRLDIWYLKAPAAGTFNMVASTDNDLATTCHVVTLTGVDQTATFGSEVPTTGTNSAPSTTVTTASGELVVDIVGWNVGSAGAVGANQTQRDSARTVGTGTTTAISTQAGADGGVMSWAQNGAVAWMQIAVPVKAAASAAKPQTLMLLGVGQ